MKNAVLEREVRSILCYQLSGNEGGGMERWEGDYQYL
jgi:hypothetical protein